MRMPPDMSLWTGRDDTVLEGPDATRIHQCIKPWTEDSPPGVCLLGFACDEGVRRNQGRVGAAEGPTALRKALANLSWSNHRRLFDVGDVHCHNGDLEAAQQEHATVVADLLRRGQQVISLGGGHETAWGSFLGLTDANPSNSILVINLDAHFDLRPSHTSHSGTPFRQMAEWKQQKGRNVHFMTWGVAEQSNTAAAFNAAEELGVSWECDRDVGSWDFWPLDSPEFHRVFESVDQVYLSLDLDVLPSNMMPAVSAPAAIGVAVETIETIIETVAASGKLAVADVVEFNPMFDHDGLAGKTAARLIWRLAKGWSMVGE